MKKLLIAFGISSLLILGSTSAQAQITFPQPSPLCNVTQHFGIGKIEISYSRPSMRGREIFGKLVPFNEVWRTGANAATTISFTDDVVINKQTVKAGKYGLLTIPGKENWTIILTKDLNVTSGAAYKQENDVLRISVEPKLLSTPVETFTIDVYNISTKDATIAVKWENTLVEFGISMDFDEKLTKQIENTMARDSRPFHSAANYFFENNKDLKKATEWINKAVELNPNAYWSWLLKAKIHKATGDYKAALDAATTGFNKAKADNDNLYMGYNQAVINEVTPLVHLKGKKK
ncbi:MAG: DUF2911 domain-containing protein [Bacteroidia bacterium]